MKVLNRYIGTTMILSTLMILLVLIGLQTFITLIKQLDEIGIGNYNLWRVMQYVPLTLPSHLYTLFPMAGLLGSLVGLGHLASNSELIVMRTAGMSIKQIIWAIFRIAILLTIIATLIGEYVSPYAADIAKNIKAIAKSGGQTLHTTEGLWMRDNRNFIHIKRVTPGQLQGITQYQFNDDHRLLKTSHAQKAIYDDKAWWLQNVSETDFNKTNVTTKKMANQPWSVNINPELSNASKIDPQAMSLLKLHEFIQYRQKNGLQNHAYWLAFWQRIFQPFSTLVMILLAIPFVFGPLRTMAMGLRLTVGTLMGFSFYLLNKFFGPFVLVYQISPIIGALLPPLLFFTIGWILIHKIR